MKKILCLLLALVMCISLVACGNGKSDDLIGTWTCKRTKGQDNLSQESTKTIELYEGGNCYCYNKGSFDNKEYNNFSGTWKLEKDLVTITLSTGAVLGYKVNTNTIPYTLTFQRDSELVLTKQ